MSQPNTHILDSTRPLADVLWQELLPTPGRLSRSARVALACVLVTVASMALETPETAVSCYLIFFAAKETAEASILQALKLIVGAAAGIGIGFIFFMLAADEPMLRMILVAVFAFTGMFFAHASRLGPIASTVGFVLAFAMTLFDVVPIPELLTRGAIWMWAVVALPMVALIVVDGIAGTRSEQHVRREAAERLMIAAQVLRAPKDLHARAELQRLLAEGTQELREQLDAAKVLSFLSGGTFLQLSRALELGYGLAGLAAATARTEPARSRLAASLDDCARAIQSAQSLRPGSASPGDDLFAEAVADLEALLAGDASSAVPSNAGKPPLLARDAFSNPEHVRFALKTTLAVLLCYVFYTTTGWFGIHTALVTCFFVALSTVGETVHKLTLRIVGCLVGAALGVASILVLMPRMEDIGHLALLVGAVAFLAAWVGNGSPRISYMGWQIALAFFLCVLHGYGPTFDLVTARDRILGILLGNIVISVVFTQLWPATVLQSAMSALPNSLRALAALSRPSGSPVAMLETAQTALGKSVATLDLQRFEPATSEHDAATAARLRPAISSAQWLGAILYRLALSKHQEDPSGLLPIELLAMERKLTQRMGGWLDATAAALESHAAIPQADLPAPDLSQLAEDGPLPLGAWLEIGNRLSQLKGVAEDHKRLAGALAPLAGTEAG